MKIKDLPLVDRPRERLKNIGVENISNEELLAIIIKTGTKDKSVKEIACEVLGRIKSINSKRGADSKKACRTFAKKDEQTLYTTEFAA